MAKAKKVTEKRLDELTPEERETREANHRLKHMELDEMIAAQRRKAERMERLNPRDAEFPDMELEEIEELEKELPEEFTDEDIEQCKIKKGLDKKITERKQQREQLRAAKNP